MTIVRSGWGRILIGFPVKTLLNRPHRPTKSLMQCATWTKLTLLRVSRFRNNGTSPLVHMLLWHRSSERAATISTTTDKLKETDRSVPPHKTGILLNTWATSFHFTSSTIYLREVRSICRYLVLQLSVFWKVLPPKIRNINNYIICQKIFAFVTVF